MLSCSFVREECAQFAQLTQSQRATDRQTNTREFVEIVESGGDCEKSQLFYQIKIGPTPNTQI